MLFMSINLSNRALFLELLQWSLILGIMDKEEENLDGLVVELLFGCGGLLGDIFVFRAAAAEVVDEEDDDDTFSEGNRAMSIILSSNGEVEALGDMDDCAVTVVLPARQAVEGAKVDDPSKRFALAACDISLLAADAASTYVVVACRFCLEAPAAASSGVCCLSFPPLLP